MNYLKVSLNKALAIVLFTIVILNANAGQVGECIQYAPNDHQTDVVISYIHLSVGSFEKCVGNNEWSHEHSNPYWRDVRSLLGKMSQFRIELDRKLTDKVKEAAIEGLNGDATITSTNIYVSGEINITIKGQPNSNGEVDLTIGGFGLAGNVQFEKSWLVDGEISVTANSLQFTAKFNVYSGEVSLVTPENNHINVDIDLSSPLAYLFPPLLIAINGIENKLEDLAEIEIDNFLESTVSSFNKSLFSLDDKIPSGEFVYNETDYGEKIKDQLVRYVEQVDISISQFGKTIDDSYVNVDLQNIHLTVGRILYECAKQS